MSLVNILGLLLNDRTPPIGIEILPGEASAWLTEGPQDRPFLFEEGNLGIPQKVVYRAYLEAVPIFLAARKSLGATEKVALINSSAVLLLARPAHQTALNARKRLVLSGNLYPESELRLAAALLSLHEGSKQSILWHHRRWLLKQSRTCGSNNGAKQGDTLDDLHLSIDDLRLELSIISQACEIYPRNYHAWTHRYLCIRALFSFMQDPGTAVSPSGSLSDSPPFANLLAEEWSWILSWIDRHISDYTAMQYACRLVLLVQEIREQRDTVPSNPLMSDETLKLDTLDIQHLRAHAHSLLCSYPDHESLWMYFRSTHQLSGSSQDRSVVRGLVESIRDLVKTDSEGLGLVPAQGPSQQDRLGSTNFHACRFLAWLIRQNLTDTKFDKPAQILNGSFDIYELIDLLVDKDSCQP